jgi:transposase
MAKRIAILTEVAQVSEASGNEGVSGNIATRHSNIADARRKKQRARRIEAMSLKLAGVSTAQIAERMGIKPDTVRKLISRTLQTAENRAVEEMRQLENARLDRAQAAIWSQVLAGDYGAVVVFLQISQRRAKLNGLDSPASAVISHNVRGDMERALADLQQLVLAGEVESATDDRSD